LCLLTGGDVAATPLILAFDDWMKDAAEQSTPCFWTLACGFVTIDLETSSLTSHLWHAYTESTLHVVVATTWFAEYPDREKIVAVSAMGAIAHLVGLVAPLGSVNMM